MPRHPEETCEEERARLVTFLRTEHLRLRTMPGLKESEKLYFRTCGSLETVENVLDQLSEFYRET